jgi:hypothetical protein
MISERRETMRFPAYLLILPALFLASLQAFPLEEAAAETGMEPVRPLPMEGDGSVRLYDLSNLLDRYWHGFSDRDRLSLIPMRFPHDSSDKGTGEVESDLETIVDALYQIIGEEYFESDENSIGTSQEKLIVKGPEAIHEMTVMVLDFFERRLNRKVELAVDVFALQNVSCLESLDAGSVDSAVGKGDLLPVARRRIAVRLGELAVLDSRSSTPLVVDYDPEVAQGATCYEPIVRKIDTGLEVLVRPLLSAGRESFDLCVFAIRSGSPRPFESRDPSFLGRVGTENMPLQTIPGPRVLDNPSIEFASTAAIVPAKPGEPALIQVAFPHQAGIGSLVIRVTARASAVPGKLDLGGQAALCAVDCDHVMAREILPQRFVDGQDTLTPWILPWARFLEEHCEFTTSIGRRGRCMAESLEEVIDMLEGDDLIPKQWDEYDDTISFRLGNVYFYVATPEYPLDPGRMLADLFSRNSVAIDAEVRFIEVSAPALENDPAAICAAGRMIGKVALSMIAGSKATAIAGLEGLFIQCYDVDVANNSSAANPSLAFYIDGVLVQFEHKSSFAPGRDAGAMRFGIRLNMLAGPIESRLLSKPGGILGTIETPRFDHGITDIRFEPDGRPRVLDFLSLTRNGEPKTIYIIGKAARR